MQNKKIVINSKKANVLAILFLLGMSVVFLPLFYLLYGKDSMNTQMYSFLFKIIAIGLGIFVHECIHGLFFFVYNKNGLKSIRWGISPKKMTAYCCCKDALMVYQYRVVLIMPFIILGLSPLIIGFIFNNFFGVIFGIVYCAASTGDLWVLYKLVPESGKTYFKDSATYCGGEIIYDKKQE